MLLDEVQITIRGGHGGAGLVSFGKKAKSGPDGGNGGQGGDVYFIASSDITLLNQFSKKDEFEAEDGTPGGRNKRSGKNGSDLEIYLPIGSTIIDQNAGVEIELLTVDQKIRIARGGLGGKGNYEFRSPRRTTPLFAQPGLAGEEKHFKIILKLIADFGLIGLPNAGKSSLLNELTAAKAKIGEYAFTTISPNLGVLNGKIIADIPGLIEGAHTGRGLGIKFLKHIEKVRLILHCVSSESEDVERDYTTVRNELEKYDLALTQKKEVVLLTKSDIVKSSELQKKLKVLKKLNKNLMTISIYNPEEIEHLISVLNAS